MTIRIAPPTQSFAALLAALCSSHADRVAYEFGQSRLSYAELLNASERLAQRLLQRHGLSSGAAVGILLPRGLELPVALLAVLRCGAHYLPLDVDHPDDRLRHMLAESGVRHVIGDRARIASISPELRCIPPSEVLAPALDQRVRLPDVDVSQRFCVLYTSGSTGRPKGVVLSHRNVLNCLQWLQAEFPLGPSDAVLHKTPLSFDVSMYELFAPLLGGARVVIADADAHRDPARIADLVQTSQITALHFVPSLLGVFLDQPEARDCRSLLHLFAAGEALSGALVRRAQALLPTTRIHNLYGPTEAGVVSWFSCPTATAESRIPIGHAVANTTLHILDDTLQPVAAGSEGELWIGGVQLAIGYSGREDLTAERFREVAGLGRLYRSGDRVRQREDGALDYLGRSDHQIKLRGIRVEPGEIEARLLDIEGVSAAVVALDTASADDARLLAWVAVRQPHPRPAELQQMLRERLPDAMVPQHIVLLDALPLLSNGKVDRAALPSPQASRPALANPWVGPRNLLERRLAALWEQILGVQGIGVEDRFFELGGSSLLALRLAAELRRVLGERVPLPLLFASPTVARLALMLNERMPSAVAGWTGEAPTASSAQRNESAAPRLQADPAASASAPAEPLAVVGMACRVPGAANIDAFWTLIASGGEGLADLSEADLDRAGVDAELRRQANYVRRTGRIDHAYDFDAEFFGMTPREAQLTDPQQRVLLECAWHALEHAGIRPLSGARVGTYVGLAHNYYFDRNLATDDALREGDSSFIGVIAADKDYAATRIAYKLDLRGPAMTLQTACSSSGVALHLAAQALRSGECDAALVGGVRINVPQDAGYEFVDGGPQSPEGRIRPFDAAASGMVLSSGVACLVLKPLSAALRDGERVYAVLRGSAINNDGADRIAYTAPSQHGQRAVIQSALAQAGVTADSIGYIEAHGTGTLLGDPIEVAALNDVYGAAERIALGSVKGNIGHLDAGAGAIGAIKAVLALHHQQLPPSIHFDEPNPECAFEQTPFFVNIELRPWPASSPRRAALSSFGFGGTNFHGIFEQAPPQLSSAARRDWQCLPLSARNQEDLLVQAQTLGHWLQAHPEVALADVAHTLESGRARLARRGFVVARSTAEAAQKLGNQAIVSAGSAPPHPSLVFMFPGQGAQHPDMGRALYSAEPVFRQCIDECAEHARPLLGCDLRELMFPSAADHDRAQARLRDTAIAQPAIFCVSLATARLWLSFGYQPDALIGHSLGEFVAATLAGVFTPTAALEIVIERGRLMQACAPGAMLAARIGAADVAAYLHPEVCIAGLNAPQLTVLAGPSAALAATESALVAAGIGCSPLQTSHAFHSPMMDAAVAPLAAFIARYPLARPRLPMLSTVSGGWADAEQICTPDYWARQLREPVNFVSAVRCLVEQRGRVLLEVGPAQTLTTSARQCLSADDQALAIASLPHPAQAQADAGEHLCGALGRLYLAGIEADVAAMRQGEQRVKLGLPGYPFARQRHFIEPLRAAPPGLRSSVVARLPANASPQTANDADPLRSQLLALLERCTGLVFAPEQHATSFLELGLDSLMLTQIAGRLKAEFQVTLRFRQLMEEFTSIDLLTAFLSVQALPPTTAATIGPTATDAPAPAAAEAAGGGRGFVGPGARISKTSGQGLNERQQRSLSALSQRYLARTARSRAFAEHHRSTLADPRTVSGFRPQLKELIYPIVVNRSAGSQLWDLDGNVYVDAACGFGSVFFGHRPEFVAEAMRAQLEQGWEIGPQHPLAGECAELFTRATGLDRVAFCNTGSEAVIAAVRLARTVTGKNLVVSFVGDYHGIQDEVLVRVGANGRTIPAAPGIPRESVANTLILEYGSPQALDTIRARAADIAAILIEPVQSRRADFQPREFLLQLRELTREADIAFIMDEVITGFRSGLQGAQGFYGVDADIATYGKVFGGGVPVGAVAGKRRFMDALDGGQWNYGDDSIPEAGVTYFAGTFVRHPLTLSAVRACLLKLLEHPEWPRQVAERTAAMVALLNNELQQAGMPMHVARYSSLWKPSWDNDQPHGDLFFFFLREQGLHIWDGRPCFLTTAHSDADCELIINAFRYAIGQMRDGDWIDGSTGTTNQPAPATATGAYAPPRPGARIGRDRYGNPAWYVPDPERSGRWKPLERSA